MISLMKNIHHFFLSDYQDYDIKLLYYYNYDCKFSNGSHIVTKRNRAFVFTWQILS